MIEASQKMINEQNNLTAFVLLKNIYVVDWVYFLKVFLLMP
jgi:hypothetical protein